MCFSESQYLMAGFRTFRAAILAGLVLVARPWAIATEGQPTDPLAVIVHKSSGIENLLLSDLHKMFTGDLLAWPDSSLVLVVEQPATSASQQRTLHLLLKTTPEGYDRQLLQVHFQGRHLPTIKVLNSDANAVRFVSNVPGAVTVVDRSTASALPSGVKVLKINGKLPGEKGYPLQ
jgi:hypothetical protein